MFLGSAKRLDAYDMKNNMIPNDILRNMLEYTNFGWVCIWNKSIAYSAYTRQRLNC